MRVAYHAAKVGVSVETGEVLLLNLWQKEAVNFVGQRDDVIVVKGARAQLHNNEMKLNASWYTNMQINPDIPDATGMLEWYNNQ